MISFKTEIRQTALDMGFAAAGFAAAETLVPEKEALRRWLAAGYHGTMDWMASTRDVRSDPRRYFPEAQIVLMAALPYFRRDEPARYPADAGNISIYARGRDYHRVMRQKLKKLLSRIREMEPATRGRVFSDSFPIMEKALAQRAGLGWIGKNSNLLIPRKGSYFFLGGILLNLPLEPDEPFSADYCGGCNRCLAACPTGALIGPRQLDARRCISYLTIEHKGAIPDSIAPALENHIFGCDICQTVCPWNRGAPDTTETDFFSRFSEADLQLSRLQALDERTFEKMFEGTPVRRAGFRRFIRNVGIAVQNQRRGSPLSG